MIQLITNLLYINLIIVLIHESGFITYVDDWINGKWKLYHLPYPIRCALCSTWWLSLLFIILTGQLTILNIVFCLLNAHLTKITIPLLRLMENLGLKVIYLLNKWLKL